MKYNPILEFVLIGLIIIILIMSCAKIKYDNPSSGPQKSQPAKKIDKAPKGKSK